MLRRAIAGPCETEIILDDPHDMMSIRFGLTLLCLGPLAVASMNVAREALLAALDNAATRDGLTGVLNRRAFMDRARHMYARAVAGDMLVLMLDIDHFKSINDTYGHAAGDEALIAFSSMVSGQLRANDLFGRIGGEEFAVVARVEYAKDADAIIQRLLQTVRLTPVRLSDGRSIPLTMSMGALVRSARAIVDLEDALKASDEALYEVKRTGRDKAVMAFRVQDGKTVGG